MILVTTYGKHIGCFKDDKKKRILPDYFILLKETNSPRSCVELCLQSGFQYAGVQYALAGLLIFTDGFCLNKSALNNLFNFSVECFCGNTEPSNELSSSECNMNCPNLPSIVDEDINFSPEEQDLKNINCGGYFAMNVFETGVFLGRFLKFCSNI